MSKKNKKKVIATLSTESCPSCKELMQRRSHVYLSEQQKKAPYHFSEWDVCIKCKRVQHYNKYKVWHNNDMSAYVKSKDEENSLLDLMRTF